MNDPEISGAAAQVAGELDPDAALVRLRQPLHEVARRDQHAGRAEAALQSVLARERRTQLLHDRVAIEAFDRLHRAAVALHRIGDAGPDRRAVDRNRASTADAVFATEMRAGQAAMLAQEVAEMGARLDQRLDLAAVHGERDRRHGASTCCKARSTAAAAMRRSTASR